MTLARTKPDKKMSSQPHPPHVEQFATLPPRKYATISISADGNWILDCPACKGVHWFLTEDYPGGHNAILVQDPDSGTTILNPAIFINLQKADSTIPDTIVCHCFIHDGKLQYSPDCAHIYAGITIPIYVVLTSQPTAAQKVAMQAAAEEEVPIDLLVVSAPIAPAAPTSPATASVQLDASGNWMINCPGCNDLHWFLTEDYPGGHNVVLVPDIDNPRSMKLNPRLSVTLGTPIAASSAMVACYCTIHDSILEYAPNCTHALAGQTVAVIPPILPQPV